MLNNPIKPIIVVLLMMSVWPALASAQNDPCAPKSGIPEGFYLFQDDILIPIREGGVFDTAWWPNGIVPYEFDTNVSAARQTLMEDAMANWEAIANVNFIERTTHSNYIHIQNSDRNSSSVGMVTGVQYINIYNWGWEFIMAHELGHALGMWHEQSRGDRDTYVTIETDRIIPEKLGNFDKHTGAEIYGPYDFDSVMHYGQCAFDTCDDCEADPDNCRTITVKSPWDTTWQNAIGQRDHLSDMDILTMQMMYPQSNWVFVDRYASSPYDGGFLNPWRYVSTGVTVVPTGGTVVVQPGSYNETGTYTKALTLWAPLGSVVIGQ